VTIAQQRAAAEERAKALLRSIVPADEWRYEPRRNILGQIITRDPTHIEFLGHTKRFTYQVWFNQTSENIQQIDSRGYSHGVCGGPYAFGDYIVPGSARTGRSPVVDQERYDRARQQGYRENTMPAHLPDHDIWLGQYLALKYDEQRFMEYANIF
jgi:hypothetical protein